MTITRPAPATAFLHEPLKALRRRVNALATATPRTRRARRRTTLAQPPAPQPKVWGLDRSELAAAIEHGRW